MAPAIASPASRRSRRGASADAATRPLTVGSVRLTMSLTRRVIPFAIAAVLVLVGFQARGRTQRGGQQGPPRIQGVEPIGLDATEEEIKKTIGAVRAGRKLTPKVW